MPSKKMTDEDRDDLEFAQKELTADDLLPEWIDALHEAHPFCELTTYPMTSGPHRGKHVVIAQIRPTLDGIGLIHSADREAPPAGESDDRTSAPAHIFDLLKTHTVAELFEESTVEMIQKYLPRWQELLVAGAYDDRKYIPVSIFHVTAETFAEVAV